MAAARITGNGVGSLAGVDVGGTFTDLILVEADGQVRIAKTPTTLPNQAFGVLKALKDAGASLAALDAIVHGTTTTTNAMLERKIAKVGLITTQGFRDVLELGRRTRPTPYGLTGRFEPLIARELRREVAGRLDAEGNELVPLDEAAVAREAQALLAAGAEAIVIHFLHSYLNPAHERRAAEIVRAMWPNPFVTVGSDIVPEYREYERGVTATVNASVQPVLARYLDRLTGELAAQGYRHPLLVMQGNGGTVASHLVARFAVNTVMSGPASGVIAAARTGMQCGQRNLITYDMGGTSSDVALIKDGVPQVSAELELEYALPIHVPMVDVHTIGAGGGSIASVDASGMLHVGPESAGATPGPICYGRGGTRPTITDANLLLGRLNPDRLLAVDNPVSIDTIKQAIMDHVGTPLGLSVEDAAAAIVRIANDKMGGAVRLVSLSRGHDPRDFALFAFGGAGPLHASLLARELGIPTVLVPARPGLTNALGCAVADLRHDFVRTLNLPLPMLGNGQLEGVFRQQAESGQALVAEEGVAVEALETLYRVDMQFQGQSHVLAVPVADPSITVAALHEVFAQAYWARFGVSLPEIRPVLVNVHTAVIGKRRALDLKAIAPLEPEASMARAQVGTRQVWFAQGGWQATPIYRREALPGGARFAGPAIVEQLDCTTVIEPGDHVERDMIGNLVITVGGQVNA
jgi:N-methylhydantoinase A